MPMPNILIFGCGKGGENVYRSSAKTSNVLAFIDNRKDLRSQKYHGLPIIGPEDITNFEFDFVKVASQYTDQISSQLLKLGVCPAKIKIARMEELAGAVVKPKRIKKIIIFLYIASAGIFLNAYSFILNKRDRIK